MRDKMIESEFKTKAQELIKLMVDTIADKEYTKLVSSIPPKSCILEGRVLNLITKERYFHKPTLAAMKAALQKMKEICERESIYKIAMPTIGAGLDRLKWEDVATQIKNVFEDTEIEILVCKLK